MKMHVAHFGVSDEKLCHMKGTFLWQQRTAASLASFYTTDLKMLKFQVFYLVPT